MALGKSSITNLLTNIDAICDLLKYGDYQSNVEGIYSCWNTFDYVSKNLGEWADDTIVGAETRQNLLRLSKILEELIQETISLINKLKKFSQQQMNINDPNGLTKYVNIDNKWYVYGSGEYNAKIMGIR